MENLRTYQMLVAAARRRAVPRTAFRHVHLAARPLVVAGYHLAGEPGAPVALCYGTDPDRMHVLVVGEPRDRTLRFAVLARFAAFLTDYLAGYGERERLVRNTRGGPVEEELCVEAPQLIVPNETTAHWLCDMLGRSLRYLRPDGEYPVDPLLPVAGAHLTWFATRRVIPGSSVVCTGTGLLGTHWQSGQLPTEDANLHALLAWVDPPDGVDAATAALDAEALPPAGPVSDPRWDRDELKPAIEAYGRLRGAGADEDLAATSLRDAAAAALRPAWQATWRAVGLVRALPEAAHVPSRWEVDRAQWTLHLDRVAAGTAHFSRRLDPLRSFRFLAELERRTAALERQMVLDDPLIMAGHVAAGDALAGTVAARDIDHFVINPTTGRRRRRPLLHITPAVPFYRPPGVELWLATNNALKAQVLSTHPDGTVVLRVESGMGRNAAQAEAAVPPVGASVVFAPFGPSETYPDNLPDTLPWTHVPAEVER